MAKAATSPKIVLREILCATDFSAHSVSVLAHAAAIARRYRSKLYVAHVIPTDVYRSVPADVMPEALTQTRGYAQDAMRKQLALESLQGVATEPVIREGAVALGLLKLADELKATVLVIGTRAQHGLERLLEGSVAEQVFRQASCPVLVVPPAAGEQSGIPIHTVLFLYEFLSELCSSCSLRVLAGATASCPIDTAACFAGKHVFFAGGPRPLACGRRRTTEGAFASEGRSHGRTAFLCGVRTGGREDCSSCRRE